jgi:hypothetical protein
VLVRGAASGLLALALILACDSPGRAQAPAATAVAYRLEARPGGPKELRRRFSARQLALLETLNRRDLEHLGRADFLVVPDRWDEDELAYSPFPRDAPDVAQQPKVLVVHQPMQAFGAYEFGRLVRWGPVSTGRAASPTPPGLYHLNWRSAGRHSTVDPDWFMPWYFNFDNRRGLSLHEYDLPGYPASHSCVRLLERDARWLFEWGEQWQLDPTGQMVVKQGTPMHVVGEYDFSAPPPWLDPARLGEQIALPQLQRPEP